MPNLIFFLSFLRASLEHCSSFSFIPSSNVETLFKFKAMAKCKMHARTPSLSLFHLTHAIKERKEREGEREREGESLKCSFLPVNVTHTSPDSKLTLFFPPYCCNAPYTKRKKRGERRK
jgi:hypothetical protein